MSSAWAKAVRCSGARTGRVGCGARFLVTRRALFRATTTGGTFAFFSCPLCGESTWVDYPADNVDELPTRSKLNPLQESDSVWGCYIEA